MTYYESYLQCKTLQDLEYKVQHDMAFARLIGSSDRARVIAEMAEKAANDKFNEKDGDTNG